jgi:hypothetical protein
MTSRPLSRPRGPLANLDSRSRLGRLLRLPLRLVPPTAAVRVLSGPLRGMRWIAGSAPAGAWVGTLERAKLKQFVRRLRRGMTVWDVGANVGLYTLPSARAVGPTGRVYAFEPMPRNLDLLRRHVAMNRLPNVEICEAAVADTGGDLADGRRRFAQPCCAVGRGRSPRTGRPSILRSMASANGESAPRCWPAGGIASLPSSAGWEPRWAASGWRSRSDALSSDDAPQPSPPRPLRGAWRGG